MNKIYGTCIFAAMALGLTTNVFAADIATNTARMQAMDKITGRVSEIDVPVGGLANFGTFSILVRKCVTTSPEEAPENTAFVDVVDNYQTDNPVNIFKGWMFSSTPALNAVEHPIYDIWLLKCYNRPQDRAQLLSAEQLSLRDSIPMSRPDPVVEQQAISIDEFDLEEDDTTASNPVAAASSETNDAISINITIDDTEALPEIVEEDFVSEGEEPSFEEDMLPAIADSSEDTTSAE